MSKHWWTLYLLSSLLKFVHGGVLLWGPSEARIPVLQQCEGVDDLNDLFKNYDNEVNVVAFSASNSQRAVESLNKQLVNLTTSYIPVDVVGNAGNPVHELTGNHTIDRKIIEETLAAAKNGNDVIVALIINDEVSRAKRKAEDGTTQPPPTITEDVSEAVEPYAEPTGEPVLYSAASPTNKDIEAMVYSSRPPLLKTNGSATNLGEAAIANVDIRDTYTRLIATIPVENGKITLRFRFPWLGGYWYLTSVEVEFVDAHAKQFNLTLSQDVSAPRRFSHHCGGRIVFADADNEIELHLFEAQAQPDAYRHRFSDAYNCVPFTTGPLWSGLLVTFVFVVGLAVGLAALGSIKSMDKFDSHKTKQLSITVSE